MRDYRAFPGLTTVACDFMLGLIIFAALLAGVGLCNGHDVIGFSAHAHGVAWPPELTAIDREVAMELRETQTILQHAPALIALALAFSSLTALNLWFVRHLSRVYARARQRKQWKG
jgi:hypothetical protein